MNYDSKEELYFSWWLDELKEAGIILDWIYHPTTYLLSTPVKYDVTIEKKRSCKVVEKTLLQPHIYSPDFAIMLGDTFPFPFPDLKKKMIVIDVKGKYAKNFNDTAFPLNQKWLYQKHGVYVQKVMVPNIFKDTFAPKRYLLTDETLKPRKIGFKVRTLEEWRKYV